MIDLYKRNAVCIYVIVVPAFAIVVAAIHNLSFIHAVFCKISTDSVQFSVSTWNHLNRTDVLCK